MSLEPLDPNQTGDSPTPSSPDSPDAQPSAGQPSAAPAAAAPAASAAPTPASPAATAAPAVTPTAAPTIVKPVRRSGLAGIVDEIRDALAGTETSKIYEAPDGTKYVKNENLSHGAQWGRIATDAIQGASVGLAAGKGKNGGGGNAALAAFQTGERSGQEQAGQKARQQNQVDKEEMNHFNMIKLKHDVAGGEFALTRLKVKANEDDVAFSQKQMDREKELGSADLGVYADPHALADVQQHDPNFWKNVYANDIVQVPEIAPDGTRKGIHVFLRTKGIGDQPVPQGTQVMTFVPGKKPGDAPSLVSRTLTGPATQNQVDQYNNAAQAKYQEYVKSEAARKDVESQSRERDSNVIKNKAEANKFNAEAAKAAAEAKNIVPGEGTPTENNAEQIVEGSMDPSNLTKRSKNYEATQKAANDYSMKKYGVPFNWAKATADYKFATNPQTQNTLNYLNSLVGPDDKTGNLANVVKMSDDLKRSDYPPINEIAQWAKLSAGNPKIAAYRAALVEVDDQIAKILQGGGQGGGGTSDAKLKQAQELLHQNFNKDQIKEVANTALRPLLANRKREMIGTNRYLMQWHGVMPSRQQAAAAPAGMVSVQIPGQPVGHIPQSALEQFKKDHPNATEVQQ